MNFIYVFSENRKVT